jgi:hypothetical protein
MARIKGGYIGKKQLFIYKVSERIGEKKEKRRKETK